MLTEVTTTLARSLFHLGRYDDSIFNFTRALEVNDKDPSLYHGRGECFSQLAKYDEAIADHTKAIELDDKVARYWRSRGQAYMKLLKHSEAIVDFSQVIKLGYNGYSLLRERGICLTEVSRYSEALSDLEKVVRLDPDNFLSWKHRGNCYFRMKEYWEARRDYFTALNHKKDADTWYRVGLIHLAVGWSTLQPFSEAIDLGLNLADCWYQRGQALLEKGKDERESVKFSKSALPDFKKALSLDKMNLKYWSKLVDCLTIAGDHREAISMCTKEIQQNDKESIYWHSRGKAYMRINKHKDALSDFTRAIGIGGNASPFHVSQYYYSRASCYEKMSRFKDATDDLHKALELSPLNPKYLLLLGSCLYSLGETGKAHCSLKKAMANEIGVPETDGNSEDESEDESEGNPESASCMLDCDENVECLKLLGICCFDLELYEEALEHFEWFTTYLRPSDLHTGWSRTAQCHFKLERHGEALKLLNKAIQVDGSNASYLKDRGLLFKKTGKYEEAVSDLIKAVQLCPSNREYRLVRMECLEALLGADREVMKEDDCELTGSGDEAEAETVTADSDASLSPSAVVVSPSCISTDADKSEPEEVSKSFEKRSGNSSFGFGSTSMETFTGFDSSSSLSTSSKSSSPFGVLAASSFENSSVAQVADVTTNKEAPFSFGSSSSTSPFSSGLDSTTPLGSINPFQSSSAFASSPSIFSSASELTSIQTFSLKKEGPSASQSGVFSSAFEDPFSSASFSVSDSPSTFSGRFNSNHLLSKVGHIEKWEQDILDVGQFRLFETYLRVGCRQSSYSRLQAWFDVAEESNMVIDTKNNTVAVLRCVLSLASKGFEVDGKEHELLLRYGVSEACLRIASCQTSIERARAWLKVGADMNDFNAIECATAGTCLMYVCDEHKYKRHEAALILNRLATKGDSESARSYLTHYVDIHEKSSLSFVSHTLLCGSLKKNLDAALYKSFFSSGMREVQLLPIIAKYVGDEEEKDSYTTFAVESSCFYSLSDVCADLLKSNVSGFVKDMTFPCDEDNHLIGFIPLLLSKKHNQMVEHITMGTTKWGMMPKSSSLDLSCLVTTTICNLRTLEVNCTVSSLSPLSQCCFPRLEKLRIKSKDSHGSFESLDGLTDSITRSLRSLDITSPNLVDISALAKCDLSSLEGLYFNDCHSLSDISCLKGLSFPNLKSVGFLRCQISDISVLSTWKDFSPSLLLLSECEIEDISPLSEIHFAPVGRIFLNETEVSDISALKNFSGSQELKVDIKMTPISADFEEDDIQPPLRIGSVSFDW